MKEEITEPVVIYYDNTSYINISKNPIMHKYKKYWYQVSLLERDGTIQRSEVGICEYNRIVGWHIHKGTT